MPPRKTLIVETPRWQVRWRKPAELNDDDHRAWVDLEARAAEPNAFMSPHFVLPALQHLDPGTSVVLAWVECLTGDRHAVMGIGVFHRSLGTRAFPWPHLTAYQSAHTYLGGLLVDARSVSGVVEALQRDLPLAGWLWQGLELPRVDAAGALARVVQDRASRRVPGHLLGPRARSMLSLSDCGEEMLREVLGRKLNEINRCMRRLREQGEVSWHCLRRDIPAESIEAFLHLEHQGWKGEAGTSLRSTPAGEAFFRDMVARFDREGRALFTELRVDGRIVASTCNLVSGPMGFAFKVAWDPALRRFGPGMLNEVEFIRQGPPHWPDLASFDSGAPEDSFISRLWPARRSLGLLLVPSNRWAAGVLGITRRLRNARQVRPPDTQADMDAISTHVKA
jgi:CelD/BcsL family acetyltransferase involved in cellulose biosynthesis